LRKNPPRVTEPRRAPHPFVYTILVLPFGAGTGYAGVTLANLATKSGLTVQEGAVLVAASLFPQMWKFFWAPVADLTFSRRRWYLISCALCAAGMFGTAALHLEPRTFRLMEVLILASSVASTFLGFALEGMIAHLTAPSDRGRVSGWYQAGNMAGNGIGGGLGLWLMSRLHGWESGLILGALTLGCAAVLPWIPDVPSESRGLSVGKAVGNVAVDFWRMIWSRVGVLSAILCIVPVGTGAASAVLAQDVVAAKWGAGTGDVELVQGFLNGIVSMAGSIIGGYGCVRLGGRVGYAVFGGIMAATAAAMAFLPATPATYIWCSLAYALATGLCYAAFSCFVLEAIGAGNAATKYNGLASLSNTPIWYMGLVLAAIEESRGPRAMLLAESGFAVLGIGVFAVVAGAWRERKEAESR
jgi:MFS family permease